MRFRDKTINLKCLKEENILRFYDRKNSLECFTRKHFEISMTKKKKTILNVLKEKHFEISTTKIVLNVLQKNILGFQKNNLECFK